VALLHENGYIPVNVAEVFAELLKMDHFHSSIIMVIIASQSPFSFEK
jgi:hypothetical protein